MKKLLVLALLLAVAGCSSRPKGQDTPQNLRDKWLAALAKGDKMAAMDCVFPRTPECRNMMWYSVECVQAANDFKSKLEQKFPSDKNVWENLWKLPGNIKPLPFANPKVVNEDEDSAEMVMHQDTDNAKIRRLIQVGKSWQFEGMQEENPWTCWWLDPALLPTMADSKQWTCWWLDPTVLPSMKDSQSNQMLVIPTENWRIWDCWWVWPGRLGSVEPVKKSEAKFGPVSKSPVVGTWYAIDKDYKTTELVLCPEKLKETLIKTGGVWYFNEINVKDPVAASDRYEKARDMFKKASEYMDKNPDANLEQVRAQFHDPRKDIVTIVMPASAPDGN